MSWKNMQRSSSTNGPYYMAKVIVCPFASPEELALGTVPCKGSGNDIKGFKVVCSTRTSKQSHHRQMWSAKKEKLLSQGLSPDNNRAVLSESFKYEDTSNWSGSLSSPPTPFKAFTEEDEEPYSLSVSLGKLVSQQLQQGNIVRVCSNRSRRDKEPPAITSKVEGVCASGAHAMEELAPLCFQDELQRSNAQIVTTRAPSAYTPLPIVSETYPVLCGGEKYKHTLFGSCGFHTLTHSHPTPARRTVHSAIVRITDSLQAEAIGRKRSERGRERPLLTAETWQGDIFTSMTPTRATRLRVLSADGSVTKDTALGKLSLSGKNPSTFPITDAPNAKGLMEGPCVHLTSPLTVSPMPLGGKGSQATGRGQIGLLSPDKAPQLLLSPKKRYTSEPTNADHRALDASQCNKRIYKLISRSVQKNVNYTKQCVATKQVPQKDEHVSEPTRLQNLVLSANVRGIEVYGVKFSRTRPNSRKAQCKYTSNPSLSHSSECHDEAQFTQHNQQTKEETKSHCVTNEQEHRLLSKINPPFDTEQAIYIPTVQHLN